MSPRNPEESTEEDVQNKVLQAVHDGINDGEAAPVVSVQQDASAPEADQDPGTKVERDRVEIYLKGPTAFAA